MDRWLKGVKRVATSSFHEAESSKAVRGEHTAITDPVDKATTSSSTASKEKKRIYDESYINFGFVDSDGSPLCMLCSKLLPNSSMAPAKLRRHLETVHPESKDKSIDFFVRKKEQLLENQKTMMHITKTINEKATEASYSVSYRIAQAGEAHTIAENLIKPCVSDIAKCMLDEKSAKHLSTVPLSNDTVSRRIHDLSTYVKQELVTRLQKTRFALQVDESTDVAGLAILLVIVRYPYESSFEEDMLMCSPLPTNTTGEEIFNKINIFFEENNLSWNNCIDICTDGAKAMTSNTAGLVSRINNRARNCTSSHCILHRQALAMKQMPPNLKLVMDEAVKIINFIKSRPLQSRLFSLMCEDYGSKHKTLLLHTEVRWLSRGKTLTRLFELRAELQMFLSDTSFNLKDRLHKKTWLFRLSFMADIFQKLNELNLSLQGKQTTVFQACNKITAFKRKLDFWIICVGKREVESFTSLSEFVSDNDSEMFQDDVFGELVQYLASMRESFEKNVIRHKYGVTVQNDASQRFLVQNS
ncbi:zinc finger BED domain-containing protein 5-like [Microplitis demolitor]|uniref:zinc finger BED domain-containing protein 5-like n=1 Tax=Microplitis demolitor TaxID=69319 RepID=UPI00235B5F2A|nr:zinc finger BED domain-containing protein 5-like [Microplitis demolitor]